MGQTVSQSDREFLRELNAIGSAPIAQICESQGVTTTAVRQRLNRLQAGGYIERKVIRAQRGRPHHEYCLTNEGKKLLGDNYAELAMVLWGQLSQIEDQQVREQIVDQVQSSLIRKYGESIDAVDPVERLSQLRETLNQHGFHIEVETGQVDADSVESGSGQMVLLEQNCPYHDLAVNDRSICDLEQRVFGEILGVPLKLTQRCVDGHSCCRFEEVSLEIGSPSKKTGIHGKQLENAARSVVNS